jgi:hypothetical protein
MKKEKDFNKSGLPIIVPSRLHDFYETQKITQLSTLYHYDNSLFFFRTHLNEGLMIPTERKRANGLPRISGLVSAFA